MRFASILPLTFALLLSACQAVPPPTTPTADTVTHTTAQAEAVAQDTATMPTGSGMTVEERLLPGGFLEIGNTNAPVSLTLFTNYSCTYCQQFEQTQLPMLLQEFGAKGTLRIVMVPFAIKKYPESDDTALTFLCAAQQGKGTLMNDLLFDHNTNKTVLAQRITEMGLDIAKLQTCSTDPAMRTLYEAQQSVAHALGISFAPTYFVNGEKFVGLPTLADLRGQINAALSATQK